MVDVTYGPHTITDASGPANTLELGFVNSELTNFRRNVIKSNLII